MKYIVYWQDILKNNQGDAPMGAFDTTIEAHAYKKGIVDGIVMFTKDKNKAKLEKELNESFYMKSEENVVNYHDPGDENDNITMAQASEMIPENIAEKMKQHNERNKLREELEEDNVEE